MIAIVWLVLALHETGPGWPQHPVLSPKFMRSHPWAQQALSPECHQCGPKAKINKLTLMFFSVLFYICLSVSSEEWSGKYSPFLRELQWLNKLRSSQIIISLSLEVLTLQVWLPQVQNPILLLSICEQTDINYLDSLNLCVFGCESDYLKNFQ